MHHRGRDPAGSLPTMLVLLTDDHLAELEARRRAWGADRHDEKWTGIAHWGPPGPRSSLQQGLAMLLRAGAGARGLVPVIGTYELPELGQRWVDRDAPRMRGADAATAALAVDIVTTWHDAEQHRPRFAADQVDEIVVVDLGARAVDWFALTAGDYEPIETSRLLDLGPARVAAMIEWPPTGDE